MTEQWQRYVTLLEEAAGLDAYLERGIADADAAYNSEARRLQNDLALAERDVKAVEGRNSRLQVGVRDLVRAVGVAVPPHSDLPALAASQITDALKAAEYDLYQIRRSVEYVKTQRLTAVPSVMQVSPDVAFDVSPSSAPAVNTFPVVPVLLGVMIGIAALISLAVVLL